MNIPNMPLRDWLELFAILFVFSSFLIVIFITKGGYRCMDCGIISVLEEPTGSIVADKKSVNTTAFDWENISLSKEPVCLKCKSKNVKVL